MMIPKIQNNPAFINDVERFSAAIAKIDDEKKRLEANNVLNKLVNEVKYLDNRQEDFFFTKTAVRSNTNDDLRKNLLAYRKKLEKLLSSYL